MNWKPAEAIARAVLYEGHLLYPYRPSALKNRRRPLFGTIGPSEPRELCVECLVEGAAEAALSAKVRFLQDLPVGTVEREVETEETVLGALAESDRVREFVYPPAAGRFELSARSSGGTLWKIALRIISTGREETSSAALVSCHALLGTRGGRFVSSTDRDEPAPLVTRGLWPTLVGSPPDRTLVLLAPIILPDYPMVARESPRDLFDLTEIDEILSLRILTLSEAEREEIRREGGRARDLLERTEALSPEELLSLHGRVRAESGPCPKAGDRVRLRPRGRADIMDLALAGMEATVLSIEEDLEGRRYIAVAVQDDPGRDLGEAGFLGHRFFFRPEEVEPV